MAGVKINNKIYPADLTRDAGTLAIKFPMNSPRTGNQSGIFNMSYTTEEQAISNYINLLLTKRGERYMQPNYGVGLWWYVFDPNTLSRRIFLQDQIEEQSALWLPYIDNKLIEVNTSESVNDQGHAMNIRIVFSATNQGANRTISVFTEAERTLLFEVQ